jgi:hypothetical protein
LVAIGRHCLNGARLKDFLIGFPFIAVAQAAWCVGEAFGYATRSPDRSKNFKRTH